MGKRGGSEDPTYCDDGSPIYSHCVPVYALIAADVQIVDPDLLLVDDEIGGHHQTDHRSEED